MVVSAETRIAPANAIILPRLEMSSILLLSDLIQVVQDVLRVNGCVTYLISIAYYGLPVASFMWNFEKTMELIMKNLSYPSVIVNWYLAKC